MLGKTHLLIGASYAVTQLPNVTAGHVSPVNYGLLIAGCLLGSLLPDIDHPQSIITSAVPFIGVPISRLVSHRGVCHSLLACVLIYGLSPLLTTPIITSIASGLHVPIVDPQFFTIGLLFGYLLHIIGDILTLQGVRFFYPARWVVRVPVFTTGGLLEFALRICLIIFCVGMVAKTIIL